MGLGPTCGAGFLGVTACTLLLGVTGTDCSCTFFAVSGTGFPGCGVKEVGENLGVLTVVFHPVVENGMGWGDEAANDIGDRDTGP